MGTYCEPIRRTDWHRLEPEESWHEVEWAQDEGRWILELIVQDVAIRRNVQLLAEALTDVRSVEVADPLEKRFLEQAEKWARETAHVSSTTKLLLHPSYRAITGMGPAVVPLLLRDLERNRRLWFWALGDITGENPVGPRDAGDVQRMAEAWLRWGRERGLL